VCPVPTSRTNEIVRDAAAATRSPRSRAWRSGVSFLAAGVSAGAANELSESTVLVVVVTMSGLVFSHAITWLLPLYRAARDPKRRQHWRSQVFQAAPDCVEFDLWSECDHEVAALRAEVVEPGGGIVTSELSVPIPTHHVPRGGYIGVGNYPQRFVGARPLVEGEDYHVVWYGQRTVDSPWMEIGRQHFIVPLLGQKVVQERD